MYVGLPPGRQEIDSSAEGHLNEELQATGHTYSCPKHPVCVHDHDQNTSLIVTVSCDTMCATFCLTYDNADKDSHISQVN